MAAGRWFLARNESGEAGLDLAAIRDIPKGLAMNDNKATEKKSVFRKMSDSIKHGEEAVADVARDALDGAADLHTDADYKAPKDQTWAKEVEGKK